MKIVSMKQLRQNFSPIRKAIDKGESFLLMYRSKPLAVIRPYQADKDIHLLSPQEEVHVLPEEERLRTLPEPKKIALEETKTKQLPPADDMLIPEKTDNPLNKFKLKKIFV